MPVYLIQKASGPIKIGFSCNVTARLDQLRVASHEPLSLIGVLDGDRSLEAAVHERFAASRLSGEWHAATDDLLALAADNPPVGTLERASPKAAQRRGRPRSLVCGNLSLGVVIESLGGPDVVARFMTQAVGRPVHYDTVAKWMRRGIVPSAWLGPLVSACRMNGVEPRVDDVVAWAGRVGKPLKSTAKCEWTKAGAAVPATPPAPFPDPESDAFAWLEQSRRLASHAAPSP